MITMEVETSTNSGLEVETTTMTRAAREEAEVGEATTIAEDRDLAWEGDSQGPISILATNPMIMMEEPTKGSVATTAARSNAREMMQMTTTVCSPSKTKSISPLPELAQPFSPNTIKRAPNIPVRQLETKARVGIEHMTI
jgi:hypothetical protein